MPIYLYQRFDVQCNRCKKIMSLELKDKYDAISHCESLGWKIVHAVEQGDPEIVLCSVCKEYLR